MRHETRSPKPMFRLNRSELPADGLRDAVRQAAGWPDATLSAPLSVRPFSRVYRASCSDGREAAVKRCLDAKGLPDTATAQRQFDALSRVWNAMQHGARRFDVPQPMFLDAGCGLYGMGWSAGVALTAVVGGADAATGAAALHDAGRWLWAFHAAGPLRAGGSGGLHAKRTYVETMAASALPERAFGQALERLRGSGPPTHQCLHTSWLHGDLKPDNLLVGTDRITGIDIALNHEDAVEHDIAQFLFDLELQAHRSWGNAALSRLGPLRTAFLEGYRRDGGVVSAPLLEWLMLWTALVVWHSRRTEQPLRGWWGSRGIGAAVRGMLARATDEPSPPGMLPRAM